MAEAGEIQWLNPRLAVWSAYEPAVRCDLCSTALVTPEGLVLVDPIGLAAPALAELTAAARPLAIVLTNGNHARSAAKLRALLGVPVFASRGAVAELDLKADALLGDGEPGPGGLRVIGLPSAGPGEVAFLHEDVLVVGDALVNLPSTGFALLPEKYCADAASLPRELRKLLSLLFFTLTFAHGAPLTDSPRLKLNDLLA